MESNWAIKEISDEEHKIINRLSEELTVSQDIAKLLVIRGINTFDEAKDFFRSSLDKLHDPFLMKDMSIAVDRVNKALRKQEKILVYGDYDLFKWMRPRNALRDVLPKRQLAHAQPLLFDWELKPARIARSEQNQRYIFQILSLKFCYEIIRIKNESKINRGLRAEIS